MHFDASPKTLKGLHTLLRKDPRVIRWTMLKEGEKIEDVVELKEQTIDHSSAFDSVASAPTTPPVSPRFSQRPTLATALTKFILTYAGVSICL